MINEIFVEYGEKHIQNISIIIHQFLISFFTLGSSVS